MSPTKYEELLSWIAPFLVRNDTRREPIRPDQRLCVTLRYLVTGDSFSTIAYSYRMSDTTVGRIVKETCKVLWSVLLEKGFIKAPRTLSEWKKVSLDFEDRWNFPNCLGAIDGKHVTIQCPPRGGSMYYNYKKFHSIVLLAAVNAKYEFIMVDVGDYGRLSDGSVFSSSQFGNAINTGSLNLPPPRRLDSTDTLYPYVFVGDDAFPLKTCLLKPYPGQIMPEPERIANYRISRARRIVENAFGIATSRFRIFRRPISVNVNTAIAVTKAVVALHNFLMKSKTAQDRSRYCPPDFLDFENDGVVKKGNWRNEQYNEALISVSNTGSNNYSLLAKQVRDKYRDYFYSTEGSVAWQWEMIKRTQNPFDDL